MPSCVSPILSTAPRIIGRSPTPSMILDDEDTWEDVSVRGPLPSRDALDGQPQDPDPRRSSAAACIPDRSTSSASLRPLEALRSLEALNTLGAVARRLAAAAAQQAHDEEDRPEDRRDNLAQAVLAETEGRQQDADDQVGGHRRQQDLQHDSLLE